ncbi:hypothetical protein FDG2_0034 [Candidatus Protofrankia californiensis]|uniref:Uncharacterized protein n=1 Tax=Candidatus Protofrankia californiensis TaxID=1839754 RepID=A0A1C3NSR2_9ACTN|nr:hypothetical protein FDG2_0034 [Candidatus Protofrankia californiensis]
MAKLDPAVKRQIIAKVCADYRADNVKSHEVIVKANGEVWIDRTAKNPKNVPFVVGYWS